MPAVPELISLHPTAHRVEGPVGAQHDVKGVDHLGGPGQGHRVDGDVGGGHVEGPVFNAILPGRRLGVDLGGDVDVVA